MNGATTNSVLRNIRLRLAYEGTAYAGWQIQPTRSTIQGCLEQAIQNVVGHRIPVLSAGRTDAGVHALGQIANFHTTVNIPSAKWRPALQSHLPEDIVILESDEVPAEFHATFSAVSKRYRYVILNRQVNDPFLRRYAWKISQPLDVASMQAAAQCLVGTHDFRSFESHWPNKATSVRTVQSVTVQAIRRDQVFFPDRLPDPSESNELHPELIALEIEADGFLYNMVRTITGTLSYVGRGTWTAADVQRVLQAQNRTIAGGTAPACGLMMVKVFYDDQNLGNQRPELRKTDA